MRPRRARNRRPDLSEMEWAALTDEPLPQDGDAIDRWELSFPESDNSGRCRRLWEEHGAEATDAYAEKWPGFRQSWWWLFEAPRCPLGRWPGWYCDGKLPEPRRRLGGIGTPEHERLATSPRFPFGLPSAWITASLLDCYIRLGTPLDVPAVDPRDPPLYESQATYLVRLGLLLPGETRRIPRSAYQPEAIEL